MERNKITADNVTMYREDTLMHIPTLYQEYRAKMNNLEQTVNETSSKVQVIESNYAKREDLLSIENKLSDKITSNFRWTLGIILPLIISITGAGLYLFLDFQKDTDNRFQQVKQNLNELDVRLTKVELRLDIVSKKLDSIDDKLDMLLQQPKQASR